MILGYVRVEGGAVSTHRDSYLLSSLTVVSTRRPFLGAAILLGASFCAYALAFLDLLYPSEIITIVGAAFGFVVASSQIGQLSLLSRDLRGSELSGVIWGRYAALNKVRSDIVKRLGSLPPGGQS